MQVSVAQLEKETNQEGEKNTRKKRGSTRAAVELPAKDPLLKSITKGNVLGSDLNLEKRRAMISAKGFEPEEFAFERAIGKNDSLYSNFTELIALTKRKVGRIVLIEDSKKVGYATGFMVSDTLLLTNWHVFKNARSAVESEVHFFYEYDAQGHPTPPVIFKFDPTRFFNNELLDYCFVAVQPTDVTGNVPLDSIGYLYLDPALGKIGDVNVEKLNIIHHPQGDFKQISIRENLFVDIDDTKIYYQTDTAQGSSGSPVFNDQWQVVGLHHRSVAKMSVDGKDYIDQDNRIIPIIDGKIDVSRVVWLKNEGIRISVLLNHLKEQNPNNALVAALDIPPPKENLSFTVTDNDSFVPAKRTPPMNNSSEAIIIQVPPGALNSENSIEISLYSKKLISTTALPEIKANRPSVPEELLLEVAKTEKEDAVDFSKCKGYDPRFLGIEVPLPQPKNELKNQIARLKNQKTELKYFKYSVIFNAVTKMPVISAVNVEGDAAKRLDDSKRSDDWLRDKRIDTECQLTDKFYAKSNFDKGHMSRFEDANWDNTQADALRNGIYTCFYTNACPQVVALNRGGGFWGKLEKAVLEKGIKKEKGKKARMTVFNGPIFNDSKDRIFKGVKIPMEYYKIVLWLNDTDQLRATAFKLSQELLVGEIEFDERMRLEEEALDIDKNVVFKSFQCSIKSLSELTKIDFTHLESFDTFSTNNGDEETLLENAESLIL
ncbi:MAG: DNA/RNA non-specific endonuclease [Spirosomataceae bacterium]